MVVGCGHYYADDHSDYPEADRRTEAERRCSTVSPFFIGAKLANATSASNFVFMIFAVEKNVVASPPEHGGGGEATESSKDLENK